MVICWEYPSRRSTPTFRLTKPQVMFLFSAFAGLPSVADGYCRSIQNSKQFRDEMEGTPGQGLVNVPWLGGDLFHITFKYFWK